jgi:DNA-binding beta-propeller fold protein YncE
MSRKLFAALLAFAALCVVAATPLFGHSVIAGIPIPGTPLGVAVDSIANRVYVAIRPQFFGGTPKPDRVGVIDGATNKLVKTVPLPFGAFEVAVDSARKRVYIAGCGFNEPPVTCGLSVLDASNNTIIGSTQISSKPFIGIQGIAVDSKRNRIYVSDADNAEVDVIDGESITIVATISTNGQQPLGLSFDPTADRVFATINGNAVDVIDGQSRHIIKHIIVGDDNANTAFNPFTHRAYVTNENFAPASSTLGVIDTKDLHVITAIPEGNAAFGVTVDALTNVIFVTNINDSTVSIVNGATNKKIQTLNVFGRNIAANSLTHRVYTTDDHVNQVHVISEK